MNKWIIKETEVLLKTPIGKFCATKKVDPKGVERRYISMQAPDWVCAIVRFGKDSDRFLMVRQFRHGNNRLVHEFPAWMVDEGECAREALTRELDEELGIKSDNIEEITELYTSCPNPAFMNNRQHCFFVVVNGFGKMHPDEDEFLEMKEMTCNEIEELVAEKDFSVMMRLAWVIAQKRNLV